MPPTNLNSQLQKPPSAGSGAFEKLAVLSADLEGVVTGCNEAALNIFERTMAEVLGQTLAALVSGEDSAEKSRSQKTILSAVLEDGQSQSSHRCQNKSGMVFAVELSVTLLRRGKSKPAG